MKLPPQYSLRSLLTALILLTASSSFAETADETSKSTASMAPASPEKSAEINWSDSFTAAVKLAKQEKKPLFIYFTGSDWCSWCQKMDAEILTSPDFLSQVGSKFVFYKADFPVFKSLDQSLAKENEELKTTYKIAGFPTIVLLTPNLQEFAKLNYREGGGKLYAEYIVKLLDEQNNFESSMKNLKKEPLQNLQSLYERASRLGFEQAQDQILAEGCSRGEFAFFMKERYRDLLDEGKINSEEAKDLRARILALDPSNKRRLHYDVALLEFEAYSKNLETAKDATRAIQPLKEYLATYGNKDLKTRWKIEMIIAQTLSSKDQHEDALDFAKASAQHAPPRHKGTVAKVVAELEQQEKSQNCIASEQ